MLYGERKLKSHRKSFKRKQKPPAKLSLPKFLLPQATPSGNSSQSSRSSTPHLSSARIRRLRGQSLRHSGSDIALAASGDGQAYNGEVDSSKEGAPLDWYGEGPRRRAGYDDMTAIDWIYEYTKERQRLRMLYSRASGVLGQFNHLWDASQVWLVLIATGASSGLLAAAIDIASDWLGDLKQGYCYAGAGGGRFYLNKSFCCWGYDSNASFHALWLFG